MDASSSAAEAGYDDDDEEEVSDAPPDGAPAAPVPTAGAGRYVAGSTTVPGIFGKGRCWGEGNTTKPFSRAGRNGGRKEKRKTARKSARGREAHAAPVKGR